MTGSRWNMVVLTMLPTAVASFVIALRFPDATERIYSQSVYPHVARAFAIVNRAEFSLAEPMVLVVLMFLSLGAYRLWRRWRRSERRWRQLFFSAWGAAGVIALAFLTLWGFNYARPSLAHRSALSAEIVDARAVLSAGERAAATASKLYVGLDEIEAPSSLPMSFEEMNRELDAAFARLALPGDGVGFEPTPAKPLITSTLFSYMGISGIFVPFTGEPSVNVAQPDVALPIVVAHEKAHQRGVTNEGEANFAAFLACADEASPLYFRYAAYLFATRYLLAEASFYLPKNEIDEAWSRLDDRPMADVRAIHEFWRRYQGPATTVVRHANDRYLQAMQVPGGVESYGTVVQLLMALDEQGALIREP